MAITWRSERSKAISTSGRSRTLPAPLVRLPGHRGRVSSLAFDAQGHHLASAVSDKTVDIWDLEHLVEAFGKLGLAW